jgi:hypothetical protein
MFENCTLKYIARDSVNISVKITYPSEGNTTKILSVPINNENTDYQNILKWVDEGNTIQEAD